MSKPVEIARKLRKSLTKAEDRAWWQLRNRGLLGFKFRRQHPFGRFVVAVELDGSVHSQPSQKRRDNAKEAYLKRLSVRVLRLPNGMVLEDPEMFCKKDRETATENFFKINQQLRRSPSPAPLNRGTLSRRERAVFFDPLHPQPTRHPAQQA